MAEDIEEFPIVANINLNRFGDWHRTINLFENDKVTIKNTTGYSAVLTIMSSYQNGEVYDTLSTTNGRIVNTPASGQFNINILKAAIAAYEFTSAVFQLELVDNLGGSTPFMKGEVKVE